MEHRTLHVLILDNAPEGRELLRNIFAARGHIVVEAAGGKTAFEALRNTPMFRASVPETDDL